MSNFFLILLLVRTSTAALNLKLNQPVTDDTTLMRNNENEHSLENFMLLSSNRPTKLNLRDCLEPPDTRMEAIIERPGSTCSFPVFGYEEATRHIKLWSLGRQLEIFQVIKIFEDPMNNSMDLFVMNMNNCEFTKTEILKGYDYFAAGGAFIVFEPENTEYFEIFSLAGEKECGTRLCKRVYDIEKRQISLPTKFPLLEDEFRDWQLTFMAASSNKGYFAIIRSKDAQIKLLSVNSEGKLINSSDDSAESKVQFLKMSTYHGAFGFCYTLDDDQHEVHCLQLDDKLNLLANVTQKISYKPSFLAVHNLPSSGGLLVLTVRCDSSSDSCNDHEMLVTKIDGKGGSSEFARFKDEGCAPRNQQQFNFYEEDGRICVFYACDLMVEEGTIQKTVRYRCF